MSGSEFDEIYAQLWGPRWHRSLRGAIISPSSMLERPLCGEDGRILAHYKLDRASVVAALALGVRPGQSVLDMCAAPGGKTLVLAQALAGSGRLLAAEVSPARRERLKKVLRGHLPEAWREGLSVSGLPGEVWGRRTPEGWDRVLLDAPCSGERHALESSLHGWSPSQTRRNQKRQLALICSAWDALAPGGFLVYSTCSVHPDENDGIVLRLSRKREGVSVVSPHVWLSEVAREWPKFTGETGFAVESGEAGGLWILPDDPTTPGWGPMYIAVLSRPSGGLTLNR